MAMAVGPASEDDVISAINTTPLVDVMLVLLIIFLITIPVVTTSIPVQLPKERVEIRETKPENVIISVDKAGNVYWYDAKINDVEVLVTKPGAGTLAIGTTPLVLKDSKPLPASD